MRKVDLSVWMIAYNHEDYINQALDSILKQNVSFNIEIVIGEDCSTDNTRKLIEDYKILYPELVKPIYYDENKGIQKNFAHVMEQCKGKYIALCEGDDYWTDPHKLQKQFDFLEANPSYSMCCHGTVEVDQEGKVFKVANRDEPEITLSQVLQEGWFIRTASMVFRRVALKGGFPDFFYTSYSTDYILQIMLLKQGNAWYLPEVMAAYRHHAGGVSKSNKAIQFERWNRKISLLDQLNSFTGNKHEKEIKFHKRAIVKAISINFLLNPNLWFEKGVKQRLKHFNLLLGLSRLVKKVMS